MTDQAMKRRVLGVEGLWQSFYSQGFYRNVLSDWRGFALRYLLLLSLCFSLMVSLGFYFRAIGWLNSADVQTILHALPTLKFKHGQLTTGEGKLIRILHPASHSTAVIVVDPEDTIKDDAAAGAPIVLQSKYFTIQVPERKAIRVEYSKLVRDGSSNTAAGGAKSDAEVEVTGANILSQLRTLADLSLLPVGVVTTILCFSFTFAKSMLLALIFKLFRTRHSYVDTTRLLIVACTPNLVLSGAFVFLNIRLGQWDSHLFNGIYILYAIFAFRACSAKNGSTGNTGNAENAEIPESAT